MIDSPQGGPASELAGVFTDDRWAAAPSAPGSLDVLLHQEDHRDLASPLGELVRSIVRSWSDALGFRPPAVYVDTDPRIPPRTFAVRGSGAVRLVGSLDMPMLEWWAAHPVSGRDGRTGVAPGGPAEADWSPARLVARAAEETLWDDPGLFWSDMALPGFGDAWTDEDDLDAAGDQPDLMRALASRRVPVVDHDRVRQAMGRLDSYPAAERAERLACELLPAGVVVEVGAGLMQEIPADRFDGMVSRILQDLTGDLGLTFPAVQQRLAPDLSPRGYRIVINRLPRAMGELPEGHLLVPLQPPPAESIPWIDPATGAHLVWLPEDHIDLERLEAPMLDAAEVLGRHLSSCLREAAGDFCDLAWTQQTLDRVAEGFPTLVSSVRARHSDERLTEVLRGLVSEGISLRLLVPMLGRLLEFEYLTPMPVVEEEAGMSGGLSWASDDSASLVAYLRAGLQPYITYQVTHELTSGAGVLFAWGLSVRAEQAIRDLARTGGQYRAAYGCGAAVDVLRELGRVLATSPAHPAATILAPIDLRAAVRRLIAAQAPRVAVVARPELLAGTSCRILGRLGP